jgi:DNA-binding transcriptional MocR family regulator
MTDGPQSGFYVRCRRNLPPEPGRTTGATDAVRLEVFDLVRRVFFEPAEEAVVSFGAAVPHPAFLPMAQLNRILSREIRRQPELSQAYDSVRGHRELRVQIARRCLDAGFAVSPEDIVTTNGAQQAVYLSLKAVANPGDSIVVETPTYVGLLQILEALRLRALQHGISIAPGPFFSACGGYRNFMRLNCATPWSEVTEGALRTLGRLVKEQC